MILYAIGQYALLLTFVDGGSFRGASGDGVRWRRRASSMASEGPPGYCNWGPLGTAASSTCDLQSDGSHVQGGAWCSVSQSNCESGCDGRWCDNDSARMLYCGVPGKCDSIGGDEVVASASIGAADVRCCTENADLGWPYKCGNIPGVFGESNVPRCHREKTFDEAVGICGQYDGGRLCSGAEMGDKCTRGTGCGSNSKLVWGCAANGAACAANAECCGGYCDGGVCEDYVSGTPAPVDAPTSKPTNNPTNQPSEAPTRQPVSSEPTSAPTGQPTNVPTERPSENPTNAPTKQPTSVPTDQPSKSPTLRPTAPKQSAAPSNQPTNLPTAQPSKKPTDAPTIQPTVNPTASPSSAPTKPPTDMPTSEPSRPPTSTPSGAPTDAPTSSPSANPATGPSFNYGNGPFVTLSTSSELVTIPRPPAPSSGQPRTNCPHTQSGLLSWHDPATWGGDVPSAGDITLPANSKVIITQSIMEELGVITVPSSSELVFGENAAAPITLDIGGMDVRGSLRAGSETCRYLTELTITLHGSRPNDLNIYGQSDTATPTYKGISVEGGIISMHGKQEYPTWSRLSESVPAGQSYLLIQEEVNWEAGQEIILVTTAIHDSREIHENEVLTIASVELVPVPGVGAALHFTTPAAHAHIANNGYQAEVGLLTRNIKVQGAADDSMPTDPATGTCSSNKWHFDTNFEPCPWKYTTGFGGHIMVQSGGKGYMEGVELYRMGQTNVLGRYPFHFHVLGECPDCYFKGNSIHESYYRCISIHGTHGTTVSENVAYDVSGFCYYLEDGVEEDNEISFNLAAHIHPVSNVIANSGGGQTITPFLQSRDLILPADVTASGFYLTNLRNDIVGNAASGGWSGFALPVLHSPIGPHKDVNMRPGNRLTKTFDGNTAHSTGWWWSHAGAFYSGGSLYYSNNDSSLLEYNAGRDQTKGSRSPCLVDKCVANNDCNAYCFQGERAWYQLTNSKVFLTASPGLNSWSGRAEVSYFEAHDVALGLEALESGFGIDNILVECRSGEEWVMPGNTRRVTANGFFWYDTGQEHIITNAKFRNCGARNNNNIYDSSSTRGCDTNSVNGCESGSSVWGFLTHSDQFTPEAMQATSGVTYEDCGRRFRLYDYANDALSTVSGRNQNWMDTDGSASGLGEPTIIGSGLDDAGHWWLVDNDVVEDSEGPLKFIPVNDGPSRGLGHMRLWFNDEIHNSVGQTTCFNGPKQDSSGNPYCPAIGRIRHMGSLFDASNDPLGGLPITANAEVAGLAGGFGWVLQLDDGPPKNLKIDQVEVDASTPLVLAIPYPQGTTFTITAHGAWCSPSTTHSCTEQFSAADSVAHVRSSQGNKYYFDTTTNLLYVRIIQFPQGYTGDNVKSPTAMWHLWDLDTPNTKSWDPRTHALDRFSFNGITLPKFTYGNYLQISANCAEGSISGHCANTPTYVEPELCPSGYVQVSYDKCCVSPGSTDCYDPTPPPTTPPTPAPTFGASSNLVLNPGFEDASNGLVNWYANSGTVQVDSTEKYSGAQSVLCKDRTSTWMGVQQTMTGRIEANKRYRLSCWAKLRTSGSATLKLSMRIEDDNGPHWRNVNRSINNNSWTLVEGEIFVDVTGTLTNLYLYAEGPAAGVEYWVDDFSVVLAP